MFLAPHKTKPLKKLKTPQELAEDRGWTFEVFLAKCLLSGMKYDAAREVWNSAQRKHHGATKRAVASIFGVGENEIKWGG